MHEKTCYPSEVVDCIRMLDGEDYTVMGFDPDQDTGVDITDRIIVRLPSENHNTIHPDRLNDHEVTEVSMRNSNTDIMFKPL